MRRVQLPPCARSARCCSARLRWRPARRVPTSCPTGRLPYEGCTTRRRTASLDRLLWQNRYHHSHIGRTIMPITMYTASVPRFANVLKNLSEILTKAEAHASARKIDPAALLSARLYPDMYALTRQVQIACDNAKGATARLADVEIPKHEDTEQSFAE